MAPGKTISCQAAGCEVDLKNCGRPYFFHKRICPFHSQQPAFSKRGCDDPNLQWRFCFKCSKLEPVSKFDGLKRNCRDHLNKMRKRCDPAASATSTEPLQLPTATLPDLSNGPVTGMISTLLNGNDDNDNDNDPEKPDHTAGLAELAKLVCQQLLQKQAQHERDQQVPIAAAVYHHQVPSSVDNRTAVEAATSAAKPLISSDLKQDAKWRDEATPQELSCKEASTGSRIIVLMDHLLQLATDKQQQPLTPSAPVLQLLEQPRSRQPLAIGGGGGLSTAASSAEPPPAALAGSAQAAGKVAIPSGQGQLQKQQQQQAALTAAIATALMTRNASTSGVVPHTTLTAAAAAVPAAGAPAAPAGTCNKLQQLQGLQLKLQQLSGQCELLNTAVTQVTSQLQSVQQDLMAYIATCVL